MKNKSVAKQDWQLYHGRKDWINQAIKNHEIPHRRQEIGPYIQDQLPIVRKIIFERYFK